MSQKRERKIATWIKEKNHAFKRMNDHTLPKSERMKAQQFYWELVDKINSESAKLKDEKP